MKRNVRIGLVIFSATIIIMLAAGNVLANSDREDNCTSSCHNDPTGMSISTISTIDVGPGETFQIDVVATGLAQDVFVLRIPADVDDNDQFTIEVPLNADDPGLVDDNDALDLDLDDNEIHAIYNLTAPAFADTYTLTVFAAQHYGVGISSSITVNVIQAGPGPSIGAPSTTPEVPRANEEFTVAVNVTSSDTITYVRLQYSLDNGTNWINVTMTESAGQYTGTIPQQPNDQEVLWRIVAADTSGTERTSEEKSYIVGQIPVEPVEVPQFHYGWLLGAPALFFAYLGTALEYYDEERFTRVHGMMLSVAYILTTINVLSLLMEPASTWSVMNPALLFDVSNMLLFMHAWHVWLGIVSMIFGTLALLTHLGGWKTCNLGLPAVVLWTILGIMGIYLGEVFVP
ncbi:MAG: hypothetical protein KGD60_06380 [Candidatus Thorarchaeota archaeon]|nr:hypothetical protein [Candidatus Thorarchaeota archaeon]